MERFTTGVKPAVDKPHVFVNYVCVSRKKNHFKKWLDAQPRGAASEIARKLGVSRQYVYKVSRPEAVLSLDRAEELSRLTGISLSKFSYFKIVVHRPRG